MRTTTPPLVRDVMTAPELYILEDATVLQAVQAMRLAGGRPIVVIGRDERCCGVLTEQQLARYLTSDPAYLRLLRLTDLRYTRWPFLRPCMSAATAARLMNERGLDVLPVVDDEDFPLGVVTREQLASG